MAREQHLTVSLAHIGQADRAVELTTQLGDSIAALVEMGCTVSLEVWFNNGSESMTLSSLSGELTLRAGLYTSLTEG